MRYLPLIAATLWRRPVETMTLRIFGFGAVRLPITAGLRA